MSILGIDDPWIWGAYVLCILSTLLCVFYGIMNWIAAISARPAR
ncbi:MAG: symporter small accessory protein [Candidatus Altiarchaeia archaeon]